jgi:RNA polymerase sigma-70 factor (ECF subfamily)
VTAFPALPEKTPLLSVGSVLPSEPPAGAANDAYREQIFSLVYRQMHAVAGGRREDLDDLVQTAVEQVMKSLPSFEGRSSFSTWVFGVCYRTWSKERRWFRRWLRRFTLTENGELPEQADSGSKGPDLLEAEDRLVRLRAALERLSPKRRTVVVLHDIEGVPTDEIAEVLSVKLNTVRSRLRDGRRDLAELLRDDPYFGDLACSKEAP